MKMSMSMAKLLLKTMSVEDVEDEQVEVCDVDVYEEIQVLDLDVLQVGDVLKVVAVDGKVPLKT